MYELLHGMNELLNGMYELFHGIYELFHGIYELHSKIPERYEKCLRGSPSLKGKSLPTTPSRREWATSKIANVGGDQMNPA